MSILEVSISLIVGVVASIMATFIYDNWIRNNDNEPAYVFNGRDDDTNNIYYVSKQEMNRKRVYKVFYILFSLYLIWASLYIPMVIKAGFMSHDILNLNKSNLANILNNFGVNDVLLTFNLITLKYYCALLSIVLLVPSIYFQSRIAKILIKLKKQFYTIDDNDWNKYRAYGLLLFSAIILLINILLITNQSLWQSALSVLVIVFFLFVKMHEK